MIGTVIFTLDNTIHVTCLAGEPASQALLAQWRLLRERRDPPVQAIHTVTDMRGQTWEIPVADVACVCFPQ